ncbi:hypothetical protein XELAEV_18012255mg [Xenopus laevis]|uniref:Fibronectin type-III domain-containing protein n=1 Tax=Xenopus laevis TaxID=8355 RepID=A0A974HY81_XENLA|nr:hypothetical protein XELAEV_18012255mg [Xenopus laevis]
MATTARVTSLKPDTSYYVTVRVYNQAGTGPSSPATNVTTSKAFPSRSPENITWTLSRKGLIIKWDPMIALQNESFVTGYKILYRMNHHSTTTLYVTSKTHIEFPFPEGASTVTIQLRATGKGGDGKPAEVHIPTDSDLRVPCSCIVRMSRGGAVERGKGKLYRIQLQGTRIETIIHVQGMEQERPGQGAVEGAWPVTDDEKRLPLPTLIYSSLHRLHYHRFLQCPGGRFSSIVQEEEGARAVTSSHHRHEASILLLHTLSVE